MSEPHHADQQKQAPRRGRPRARDPLVPVTTWLPESLVERIDRVSARRGEATSHVVRRCVILQLRQVEE